MSHVDASKVALVFDSPLVLPILLEPSLHMSSMLDLLDKIRLFKLLFEGAVAMEELDDAICSPALGIFQRLVYRCIDDK